MKRTRQTGHVFKSHGAWYVRYREYVNENGRAQGIQRCARLAGANELCRTKAEARELAEEFLRPFNDGTFTLANANGLGAFIENTYLRFVQDQKRPSTSNGYAKLAKYFAPYKQMPLRRLRSTFECERVLHHIARTHDISRTTMMHLKYFFSGVMRYAIRTGTLNGPNPVREVCVPECRDGGSTHAYSIADVERMLAALPKPERTIVAAAAFTGLRKGELMGLRTEDYDGTLIHVRRSRWRSHMGEPKGKHGKGAVFIIAPLREYLDSHLIDRRPGPYLFTNAAGNGPVALDYVTQTTIVPTLTAAGIEWHGWHAFRRGLATNLHEPGVADIVIQSILRHSSVAITRQAYIKHGSTDARSIAAMKVLEAHCAAVVQRTA